MTQECFPCGIYELEPNDEIVVFVKNANTVVKVGDFKDHKGRKPKYMVEQVDADRFFFTAEQAARDFMLLHGLTEVTDQQLNEIRNREEAGD
ncbi:MAG: hypothetical protein WCI73_10415 [Phycisphaerae bacterium]